MKSYCTRLLQYTCLTALLLLFNQYLTAQCVSELLEIRVIGVNYTAADGEFLSGNPDIRVIPTSTLNGTPTTPPGCLSADNAVLPLTASILINSMSLTCLGALPTLSVSYNAHEDDDVISGCFYNLLVDDNNCTSATTTINISGIRSAPGGIITQTVTCGSFWSVTFEVKWTETLCNISAVTATPTACSGATYNVSGSVTFTNPPATGTLTVSKGAATQVFNAPFTSPLSYSLTGVSGAGAQTVNAVFSATACSNTGNYTGPNCSTSIVLNSGTNNTTVTACSGTFVDSGDSGAAYGNGENNTITLCSGTTQQITTTFKNFSVAAGDQLFIYDGPNTSSPQVTGSPFSGSGSAASPGIVTASGTCLTFRFVSDGSGTAFGWEAMVSCTGGTPTAPPAPTWTGYSGTACTPNTKIEGTVFEDFDDDGIKDAAEPFMKGVEVKLYDNTGQVGGAVTTDVNGLYSFTGLVAAAVYRVEFTIPANFKEGAHGSGSGTGVQFARAGTCSVNLGLLDKGHYCGLTNPKWTTPCYNNGDPMHASNSAGTGVARFDYTASGQSPAASYQNWVQFGTIGTVWGTAYRRDDATLYMASVLRRHTGLGPGGIGAIYKRADAGTNTSATVFYDFGATAGTVASNATRFPGTGTAFGQTGPCGLCDNLDPTTFGQIGKTGLGDIDLNTDESVMYVTNLFDRKVYSLSMPSPAPGSAAALPNQPWIVNPPCTGGTARPWALKYRQGKLYVGVVCDASGSSCAVTGPCNNLTATVYAYDGSTWTTVVTYPLNYFRKAYALGSNYWVKWLDNWSDFTANYANVTDAHFAQPVMVDLEFDDDGSMIMGFGDRTAMQTGYQAPPPPGPLSSTAERTFAHGDMLRAAFNAGTGTFTLENNGIAGTRTTTNPASNVGPGGRAFYWGDFWYGANNDANIGALAILPGSGEILHPVADPIDPYASGVVWSSNFNGSAKRKLEVYQGSSTGNAPNFAKNGGLGDIELHCAAPPLEIGNYVWWDHNLNGRMDPSEPGISNVNLTLYRDPNGNTAGNNPFDGDEVAVATTKTDAFGRYIFSFAGASNGLMAQTWIPAAPNNRVLPNIKYAVRINNFATDAGLTAFATGAGSPTFIMSPTQNQGGMGGQRDNNSYNNPGNATSTVATGGTGDNDHNFDFAFGPASACDITAVPFGNTPCVGETLNLNANATGGTPPLTYSWAGPNSFTSTAAAPSIANVTAAATGTYTVTITNAACSASFTVLVQVNGISVTASTTPTACGGSTGSISLTPSGGFNPYNFDWANNTLDGQQNPTGLAAGNYPVTVTDANGCSATTTASIANTGGPTVSAVPTNPTCGLSNGSIAVTVTGTGPFTYDWNVNALDGTEDPTGLGAGTYSVTVTDGACIGVAEVTLTNTAGPSLASPVFVNTTCGLNNGSIDLTASGGLAPYTYDWNVNTLDGTEDPTGLAAGTYTVTVYDANNCSVSATVMIAPSTGFTASIAPTNETCSASNGAVSATAMGGTAPFSYDWNNIPGTDNGQMQSGLGAGTYAVTITDALGCTATDSDMITNTPGPTLTLTPVNAQSCVANNGSINLQVTGSTGPYFYDWSNDNDPAPDRDSEDLMGLAAGTYTVTVEDANGCTVTGTTVVGLNTGAMVTPAVTDPTTCAETGSITLGVSGGVSPYTYDWSNVPGTNNPANQTGLAAGVYVVTVTEANGCTTVASASVRDIREPALTTDLVQPTCGGTDGAIDLEVVGGDGVGPYSYNWSNLAPTSDPQDQMGVGAGNYTVTVTDELQCTTVLTVSLSNSAAPELTITPTNGSCGMATAGVEAAATGGTPGYTYNWDNLPAASDPAMQTGLPAGTYAVTVMDGAGCIAVGSVMVNAGSTPTLSCSSTPALDGGANGTISVMAAEVAPFTFDWNVNALDGQQNPTGLAAGTYTVTVTDGNNCTAVCTSVVAATFSCNITAITFANQSVCNDNGTGSNSSDDFFTANITVTFSGPPASGSLDLTGDVLAGGGATSVPVATAGAGPTYTFTGVRLRADGTATAVTAAFSANTACTFSVTNGPNVPSCSVPTDYGDLPAPYPNNVSHTITPTLYLGTTPPDPEPNGQPNGGATGDGADEDGLTIPPIQVGAPATFTAMATNNTGSPAFLTDFFDSNGDGDFSDPGESMTVTVPTGTNNGSFPIAFNVPPNAPVGADLGIRVRLSTQSGLTPTGAAPDGEVEDYLARPACNNPNLIVGNGQVCSGSSVDLATLVTNAGGGTLTYHSTIAAANAGTGALPSSTVTPAGATNYYVRSTLPNGCFAVQEVTVTIKAPVCGVITVTGPN
jgi:hypothetical protein